MQFLQEDSADLRILGEFWTRIEEHFGLKFSRSRHSDIAQRLLERAQETGSGDIKRYVQRFLSAGRGDPEFGHWASVLTVNETYFFRNANDWSAVRHHVLPDILRRKRERRALKVLSLGCATGEELYSMALLLLRHFPVLAAWDLQLLGGDIDEEMLSVARAGGPYGERSMRRVHDADRAAHFVARNGAWYAGEVLRTMATFRHCNLLRIPEHSFLRQADIIFCRNVLIYFDVPVAASVIRRLCDCLADGGSMIIGHSEALLAEEAGCPATITSGCIALTKAAATNAAATNAAGTNAAGTNAAATRVTAAAGSHAASGEGSGTRWHTLEELLDAAREHIDLGRLDEARSMLGALLLRDPASPRAQYLIGLLHTHAGELERALAAFECALRLAPDDVMSRFQAAMLCRRTGDRAAADAHFTALRRMLASRDGSEYADGDRQYTVDFLSCLCGDLCAVPAES